MVVTALTFLAYMQQENPNAVISIATLLAVVVVVVVETLDLLPSLHCIPS